MFALGQSHSVRLKSRPKFQTDRPITQRDPGNIVPRSAKLQTLHATPRTTKAREPGNKPRGRATRSRTTADASVRAGKERPTSGRETIEAPVNGGRNYNGPKVAKFLVGCGLPAPGERPYEASLFPGIGFGLFLRSLGPTGQGTVSGRQFLWGVGLPKGNGGVQRFPRAGRRLALECKGRRELDCKTHPSSRDESRP
ncbi:unnamed protein product [Microthlaspi erraticum]|uniref:Uncharacterized protein n=1 Tax=Microthlaspi erraticum TaxID=1685480 RepID=A0A6D2J9E2_9BRAS|nr:unnamed protein product [Microthlaspi erraticum]